MCARSDAVQEVRQAAECLSQACAAIAPPLQSLRDHYNSILEEELPADLKRLIDRLK